VATLGGRPSMSQTKNSSSYNNDSHGENSPMVTMGERLFLLSYLSCQKASLLPHHPRELLVFFIPSLSKACLDDAQSKDENENQFQQDSNNSPDSPSSIGHSLLVFPALGQRATWAETPLDCSNFIFG
jgi:hypothetical protein